MNSAAETRLLLAMARSLHHLLLTQYDAPISRHDEARALYLAIEAIKAENAKENGTSVPWLLDQLARLSRVHQQLQKQMAVVADVIEQHAQGDYRRDISGRLAIEGWVELARHYRALAGLDDGDTDPMTHGTRKAYQAGCLCLLCRAAEASYRANLRAQHLHQRPPLGTLVPAAEAYRRLRQLKAEGFSRARLATELGLKTPRFRWHPDRITVRTLLKVRRLARRYLSDVQEDPDRPKEQNHDPQTWRRHARWAQDPEDDREGTVS